MSSPVSSEDPRSGRDRRVVARRRTFKHGTVDPVINHRRPLLTWGNAILVAIMVGFALYATGNLPQLDAFFDHLNNVGRSHNNTVVNAIITFGPYLFGAVILAVFGLFVFLFINSNRREHSDPKGWHKVADAPPNRRSRISRRMADLPSMVMPIGKTRPGAKANPATPARPPTVPQTATPIAATTTPAATTTIATPSPDPIKAAAIAAAAKAEAALQTAPADLPSFVRPLGKTAPPTPPAPPVAAPQNAAATTAKLEATLAAAKAAAAKAEAAIATAKAEAALAAAKLQAAEAEAALAAAKANAITSGS